jgi:endonuclease/exonuclease/phosphatase family metal-dependent hydrolase
MTIQRKILRVMILLLILTGIWLLNVSKPGSARGCPRGCSTAALRRDGPLRILSINVLHGHPDFENLALRMDMIAEEIIALDADVVMLQEVPWTLSMGEAAAYLSERCGYNYLYLRSNGNRWAILFEEGSAILSRYELKNPSSFELRPRAAFFEHRTVLHSTLATESGDLDVFVTHLTDGEDEINRAQVASLQAYVNATGITPAIIGGDFNAEEDEDHIVDLGPEWIDTHTAANPGERGFTCCIDDLRGGPAETLEKRIDYLFLIPRAETGFAVRSSNTILDEPLQVPYGWQWASDHVGLFVELEMWP